MSDDEMPLLRRERPRPKEVLTVTHKMTTPRGSVYVRIGIDEKRQPIEVFVDTGVSGGYTRSWVEALGITISKALQNGTKAAEIMDGLLGISGGKVAVDNGDNIYSVPDAVGIAMMRTIHDQGTVRGDATDSPPEHLPAAGTGPTDVDVSEPVDEAVEPEEFEDLELEWDGDAP